ncbi:peptidoglycan-associated lipoprotein Pal [Thermodesulfobacteriota bacterium]
MSFKSVRKLLLAFLMMGVVLSLVGCPDPPVEPPVGKDTPQVKKDTPPPPPPPKPVTPPETDKGTGGDRGAEVIPPKPVTPPPKPVPTSVKVDKLDTVYFDFDRSNIRSDQEGTMSGNAAVLTKPENEGANVTVEGHCDERGTDEYNIALGDRRAKSAKKFLVKMGIGSKRISTISYGESKPAKSGHNEAAWKLNRRAEFLVK